MRPDGHFSFWAGRSIYDITKGNLYGWSMWLADRNLSAKTWKNVMGAFHSSWGTCWIERRFGESLVSPSQSA